MLNSEVIAVHSQNQTKLINSLWAKWSDSGSVLEKFWFHKYI